jgi:glycosidase
MPDRPDSIRGLTFEPRGEVFPSPIDWRDHVFYQLLVDRFDDDRDHPPYDPATSPRGRDRAQGNRFQGGRLRGITRRLDYIRGLGCTAVWISPPFKQRADSQDYHGYGIQDFLAIDPRFGTIDDLRELTREAHRRGMYVILDIVINHTADVFRYAGDGPHDYRRDGRYDFGAWHKVSKSPEIGPDDAIWPRELQDPDAFKRKGSIRDLTRADPDEAVNGDFLSLKELDLAKPGVMDVLVQAYKYWIAAVDADGYRIDTVRNIEPNLASVFINAIREYTLRIGKRNFLIFGEIVGDDDLLRKYVGNNTPAPGDAIEYPFMNACLDFPLYAVLDETLKGRQTPGKLWDRYDSFRRYYRNFGEAGQYYVTFVDNHDQSHRPWRRFLHGDTDPRLAVLAAGYLLTNIGIPCLYSGTEQGFDGGGDADFYIREAMFGGNWGAFDTTGVQFFDDRNPIYAGVAKVAEVRRAQPALRYGRQYFREISGNGQDFGCPTTGQSTTAYSRVLDTDEILVCLNLDTRDRQDWVLVDEKLTSPGATLQDLLGNIQPVTAEERDGKAAVRVPLPGRTMVILKAGGGGSG